MLFAMFEDDLNQLCKSIAVQRKLTLSLNEAPGRGIERAKAWLKKVAALNLTAVVPEWTRISRFRDLRNVLVHAAGFLDLGNPQHERIRKLAKLPGSGLELHYHARTEVTLRSDFLPMVIDTFETFYNSLPDLMKG